MSLALFAGLALVVSIGGFFNIRSLFKSLSAEAKELEEKGNEGD